MADRVLPSPLSRPPRETETEVPPQGLWPSKRYFDLVERLSGYIGRSIHISVATFTGGFVKEGQPYRLLDVAPFPEPRAHPHPCKRAYPHMLVLASERPPERSDAHWRNGVHHGGAVNLAHVGTVTTTAFPQRTDQFLYANIELLAWYYDKAAETLLTDGTVPEGVAIGHGSLPDS